MFTSLVMATQAQMTSTKSNPLPVTANQPVPTTCQDRPVEVKKQTPVVKKTGTVQKTNKKNVAPVSKSDSTYWFASWFAQYSGIPIFPGNGRFKMPTGTKKSDFLKMLNKERAAFYCIDAFEVPQETYHADSDTMNNAISTEWDVEYVIIGGTPSRIIQGSCTMKMHKLGFDFHYAESEILKSLELSADGSGIPTKENCEYYKAAVTKFTKVTKAKTTKSKK